MDTRDRDSADRLVRAEAMLAGSAWRAPGRVVFRSFEKDARLRFKRGTELAQWVPGARSGLKNIRAFAVETRPQACCPKGIGLDLRTSRAVRRLGCDLSRDDEFDLR